MCFTLSYSDEYNKKLQKVTYISSSGTCAIKIPKTVTLFEDGSSQNYIFKDFCNIKFTVTFEDAPEITRIGNFSFYSCAFLENIDLSSCTSLTVIGHHSFSNCAKLTTIKLPSSLTNIYSSFQNSGLTSIHFPKKFLGALSWAPFKNCYSLESITFEDNADITTLYQGLFKFTGAKRARIPKNVHSLYGETFGCTRIEEFTIEEGNNNFAVYEKSLYSSDFRILYSYIKTAKTYTFHPNTTAITPLAFAGNYGKLVLPQRITSIGTLSFHSFYGTEVILHSGISQLTERAFGDSINLKNIYLPEGVTSLPDNCFLGCSSLRSVYLPYTLSSISDSSFTGTKIRCFYGNVDGLKEKLIKLKQVTTTCAISDKAICTAHESRRSCTAFVIIALITFL